MGWDDDPVIGLDVTKVAKRNDDMRLGIQDLKEK